MNPLSRIPLFQEKTCRINRDIHAIMENPPDHTGPFLKFHQCVDHLWQGDILFVHELSMDPVLCFEDEGNNVSITSRSVIYEHLGYRFTKWEFSVKQQQKSVRQDYVVQLDDNRAKKLCFFLPGFKDTWKWVFFSCNDLSHTSGFSGYSEKYGGIVPLWTDLVHKHHEYNYHLMVGLGDQVYLDEVFEHIKQLNDWTYVSDRLAREAMACPKALLEQVDKWTLFYYIRHFSQPYFEQALATIPSLLLMSDHDTYDGQGSYPEDLENSPVLRDTRRVLQKYYLIFQQHQNPDFYFSAPPNTVYGDGVAPFVKQLGDKMAILGLDTRFERTRDRIIPQRTYDYIYSELEKLPDTIIHLVVATEIPLIFPDLRFPEKFLTKISNLKRKTFFHSIFRGTTMYKTLGLPFGEPLLLTDLVDHWNSVHHISERNAFLWKLQDFAKRKSVRVSFIGGDVHCAGVGRFATPSASPERVRAHYEDEMIVPLNFAQDHRLMYQIISSAIANVPPPWYIIKAYHLIDKPEKITGPDGGITDGRMLRFFLRDTKGRFFGRKSKKLMGKRNWCSVEMSSIDDSLFFELHVEMFMGAGKTVKYNIIVPALELSL